MGSEMCIRDRFYIGRKLAVPESVAKAGFRGGPFYIGSKMNEECLFWGGI